ncbi:permease [Lentibacillus juripiscarius]|uniref:Permease n=1 Tax=Lentibacillus juripiscarius TaxID=257446 RepID=A0ABW5VCX4_9BACI
MGYRKTYLFFGCIFIIFGGFHTTIYTIAEETFPTMGYTYIALIIMCFCLSYLAPQFQRNDERTKFIRHKAMFYSFFSIVVYLIVLIALLNFNVIALTALQALNLLLALSFITVFLSMVILSKFY